ncbi:MAG: hypothetical protein IJY39_10790 [Clostridia bacterium]|nr:hypothetical protein [Clostridia bacterium]
MKKQVALRILTLLLAALTVMSAVSCSGKAPELDGLKERFVYLIEESKELNVLFFGSGLPVYRRGDLLSERKLVYLSDTLSGYDRVMDQSSYFSPDEIKAEAELVFSEDYLSELYESAFDGIMIGDSTAYIRFYDDGSWLYQNTNATDFQLSERIYDYSTMRIIDPSTQDYINVSIESYTLSDPTRRTVYLSFVYENGNWYLDSPTY